MTEQDHNARVQAWLDEDGDVLMAGATYELMRFDDGVPSADRDGLAQGRHWCR